MFEFNKDFKAGLMPSPKDDRDHVFKSTMPSFSEKYALPDMYDVYNQGNSYICGAVCIAYALSWLRGLKSGWKKTLIDPLSIYKERPNIGEGVVLRNMFKVLKNKPAIGIDLKYYSRVNDIDAAKGAILMNGPVIIGTYAYNENDFWKPSGFEDKKGGHATILTGWDKDGFVLQNSWGTSWKNKGKTIFPYSDFKYVIEAWTLFS